MDAENPSSNSTAAASTTTSTDLSNAFSYQPSEVVAPTTNNDNSPSIWHLFQDFMLKRAGRGTFLVALVGGFLLGKFA
jgi:hypothetical protein